MDRSLERRRGRFADGVGEDVRPRDGGVWREGRGCTDDDETEVESTGGEDGNLLRLGRGGEGKGREGEQVGRGDDHGADVVRVESATG